MKKNILLFVFCCLLAGCPNYADVVKLSRPVVAGLPWSVRILSCDPYLEKSAGWCGESSDRVWIPFIQLNPETSLCDMRVATLPRKESELTAQYIYERFNDHAEIGLAGLPQSYCR